jgi:hypothetical protein
MAIKAGNIVIGGVSHNDANIKPVEPVKTVFIEKNVSSLQDNVAIVGGKPKKFNKISRYMLDMLTTEE